MNIEQYTHVEKLVEKFEKPAMKSKKFKAFLFMEIWLGALAALALVTQPGLGWPLATFMSLIVLTMGAIALTFNGYQAALDKYFRGAAMMGQLGEKVKEKIAPLTAKKKRSVAVQASDEADNDDKEA